MTDEDVRQYFEENKSDYYVEPRITFTHVFFSAGTRGEPAAMALAEQTLAGLREQGAGFNDAPGYGERFLYGMNYLERSRLFVESHFGPDMTEALFALEPVRDTWYGPFASPHGAHLVMVTQKQAGYLPLLAEVRTRVAQEASRALAAERTRQATREIVDSYDVEIVYARPDRKLARNDR